MKKSTKIILPALALLVLGTTAAATSTVAWFAANGTVSATGMQVRCQTSTNLLIANSQTAWVNGKNYGSDVSTLNTGIKTLSPSSTTTEGLKTPSFFVAEGSIGAVNGDVLKDATIRPVTDGTNETVDEIADDSAVTTGRYAVHNFWVANSAKDNLSLSISELNITSGGKALSKGISNALRVGIVYQQRYTSDSTYTSVIFRGLGDTVSYQGLSDKTTTKVTSIESGVIKENDKALSASTTAYKFDSTSQQAKLGNILSTTEAVTQPTEYKWSSFKVYVWYEGQDEFCTANYALSTEDIEISFKLAALPIQTPSQGN